MTKRSIVTPTPDPLEGYAARFDNLFGARAQREGFRRYLEGTWRDFCFQPNVTRPSPPSPTPSPS